MPKLSADLLDRLAMIVGPNYVKTDPSTLERFGSDRTTGWQVAPAAVIFPDAITEVQKIVQLANAECLAIVPCGGRTGLSGGAVARRGELVVAMDRINEVLDFNPVDRCVTVGAGMITRHVQEFATAQNLFYPVDFASSGSSHIGGNIATNAGGIKVIRWGMTRDWVMGLRVVTGAGEILDLNRGLTKNSTGFDFRHLFIGSEGTLGIICEVTLRLIRPPDCLSVLVLGVRGFSAMIEVLKKFRASLPLTAFEFFSDAALERVVEHTGLSRPFFHQSPFYVLVEVEQHRPEDAELALQVYETCKAAGWVDEGVISQSDRQAAMLWRLREDISESLSRWKPHKYDLSVRVSRMATFIEELADFFAHSCPELDVILYGHIGDGNLHINILKPDALDGEAFATRCVQLNHEVCSLVSRYEGSISAEHGVGLVKKEYLGYSRQPQEIELMRAVRRVFDPNGIMNPGKLVDL